MTGEPTHRDTNGEALCGGEAATRLSLHDEAVTCETCRALLALQAMHRRRMIQRSLVLIAKLASA